MPSTESRSYQVLQPLILAAMVAVGMLIGLQLQDQETHLISKMNTSASSGHVGRVEEILRFIESKYVSDLNNDDLTDAALHSVLKKLDPHSVYIPQEDLDILNNQMKGSYFGLGIETFFYDDFLTVVKIIKDSPADLGGLKKMDKILSVNGHLIDSTSNHQNVKQYLDDSEYPKAELVVSSTHSGQMDTLYIMPAEVYVPSVDLSYVMDDSIAYIRINKFSNQVYKEFMQHLEHLDEGMDVKHLILDLRNNPGGYLPETVKILSQLFNDKDKLLVYTKGKNEDYIEYNSTGKPFFSLDRVAVLVDAGSASGSEIIAGAIQDWDRGVIIGSPTYGKGLVQEQFSLSNGGAIRLTVAKYYTPSGRCIQKPYETDFEKRDTNVYTSMLLQRPLQNAGGIVPDITIDGNRLAKYIDEERVSKFALDYIIHNVEEDTSAFMVTLRTKALANDYYTSLPHNENINSTQKKFDKITDDILAHRILSFKYNDSLANRYIQQDDSVIAAAKASIKKRQILALQSQ